jgi:hypothetical protein
VLDGGADQDSCTNGEVYISCNEAARAPAGPAQAQVLASSFAASFTNPDQTVVRTLSLPASTPGVTALLIWDDPAATFGVDVELVSGGQVVARGLATRTRPAVAKPAKLRVKVTRGAGYMTVQAQMPAKLRASKKPLKLRLKVRAKKVKGKTRVATRVLRQKPRG